MVNMPQGSAVAPAPTTKGFAASLDKLTNVAGKMATALAPLAGPGLGAVLKLAGAAASGGGKTGKAPESVQVNVTLELDKKVLSRHTEEVMLEKLNPNKA